MSKLRSVPPIAAPFPAPNGFFDFSAPAVFSDERRVSAPTALEAMRSQNTVIPCDAAEPTQKVKAAVFSLAFESACRLVLIDVEGECGLEIFDGAAALAAYTVKDAAEAMATLGALDAEIDKRKMTGVSVPEIVTVTADPKGRLGDAFYRRLAELSRSANAVGAYFALCSPNPLARELGSAIDVSAFSTASDGEIKRKVRETSHHLI